MDPVCALKVASTPGRINIIMTNMADYPEVFLIPSSRGGRFPDAPRGFSDNKLELAWVSCAGPGHNISTDSHGMKLD